MTPKLRLGSAWLTSAVVCGIWASCVGTTFPSRPRTVRLGRTAAPAAAKPPADQPVLEGTLSNGLRYFVKAHTRAVRTAHFELVVKAGFLDEDPDQREVAHLVEHMAFRGTKRFPGDRLLKTLTGGGLRLGSEVTAATSERFTRYQIEISTDQRELVDTSVQILRDWAGDISFDPAALQREQRHVLAQVYAMNDADLRFYRRSMRALFPGLQPPIALAPVTDIQSTPPANVRRFYQDWYRPDLMAVVAVGDFSAQQMVERLRREFGSLALPATPRPRRQLARPPRAGEPLVAIAADAEATATEVRLALARPRPAATGTASAIEALADRLYRDLMTERLIMRSIEPAPPFFTADLSTWQNGFGEWVTGMQATTKEGHAEAALTSLLQEMTRVSRDGFTTPEIARGKRDLLRAVRHEAADWSKRTESEIAEQIVMRFLDGEGPIDPGDDPRFVEQFVNDYTPADLQRRAAWWAAAPLAIQIAGPSIERLPNEKAVARMVDRVGRERLPPFVAPQDEGPLMPKPPRPGHVVAETQLAQFGAIEWLLENGARVLVKPTRFRDDEVLLYAHSQGGHSRVAERDFAATVFSPYVVEATGLGTLDAAALRRALAGRQAWVSSEIRELSETVDAGAAPADLLTMFELVHLTFVGARADSVAFANWRDQMSEWARLRRHNPSNRFREDLAFQLFGRHPRWRPPTPETFDRFELTPMLEAYRARFADAGDFTFAIVGNVDPATLRPLVETYIGGLPGRGRTGTGERWNDIRAKRPAGPLRFDMVAGQEPSSDLRMIFMGEASEGEAERADLEALVAALRMQLYDQVRGDRPAGYVRVTGGISWRPRIEYEIDIALGCAPEDVEQMRQRVLATIAEISARGVSEGVVTAIKNARIRDYQEQGLSNDFWAGKLASNASFGADSGDLNEFTPVDPNAIRAAARRYLQPDKVMTFVRRPEGQKK